MTKNEAPGQQRNAGPGDKTKNSRIRQAAGWNPKTARLLLMEKPVEIATKSSENEGFAQFTCR